MFDRLRKVLDLPQLARLGNLETLVKWSTVGLVTGVAMLVTVIHVATRAGPVADGLYGLALMLAIILLWWHFPQRHRAFIVVLALSLGAGVIYIWAWGTKVKTVTRTVTVDDGTITTSRQSGGTNITGGIHVEQKPHPHIMVEAVEPERKISEGYETIVRLRLEDAPAAENIVVVPILAKSLPLPVPEITAIHIHSDLVMYSRSGCTIGPGNLTALVLLPPLTGDLSSLVAELQFPTVTSKKVAGIEVASALGLVFCSLKSASSSACRSASRPSAVAASNAFMVGP
jgi:hypothetical protein